tara:strand:+ start:1411 stop:1860 length:450 start_codon:yes stop_codon:yes gene_type:complete
MKGLDQYNLRDLQKEYMRRVGLREYSTPQLLAEVCRRDESDEKCHIDGMMISHREFLKFSAEHFGLTVFHLTGTEKHQPLSRARQVTMVAATKVFKMGARGAAQLLRRKDPSSLHHAMKMLKKHPALEDEALTLAARWRNRNNTRRRAS